MSTTLAINLKRASKVYHEGDMIAGVVVVESSSDVRHEGLTLVMEGGVTLTPGARARPAGGLLDAFSSSVRPIPLVHSTLELSSGGRVPAGVTEVPFEVPLCARPGSPPGSLLETYHGVFVSVGYSLRCHLRRPLFNKPLHASCQFFVQQTMQDPPPMKPVRCEITPATIRAGSGAGAGSAGGGARGMPHFQIYAEIDSTVCALDRPLTGKIRVDECSVPIKSIELQLVRVETCGGADVLSRDATEVQNIQAGAGDVCRARDIPLHMVLPRLFTCPTTATPHFKIEFEVNMAVIFEDDYLVTENFPILLLRCR